MAFQVLSESDIEQFIHHGYVQVKEAFPREIALEAQSFLWDRLIEAYLEYGMVKDAPETWAAALEKDANAAFPTIHLRTFYNEPEFKRCETQRLAGAIEDLIGIGRWALKHEPHNWGWWPINFAVGTAQPWEVPTAGWHWDGMNRKHKVTSPEQGLLVLPCFSDVASKGGGTLLARGSHQVVARYLSRFPDGQDSSLAIKECAVEHPWLAELTGAKDSVSNRQKFLETPFIDEDGTELQVVETIARAGDVLLGHPFLFHAASQNHSGMPRFMCNRAAPLTAPMELNRPNDDYSVLELSIRHALKIDS
ncbi:MAG: phytanoyl-CoA dioxygenase family protein [Armatimonas sp.]